MSRKFANCTDLFYVSAGEDGFGLLSGDMWVYGYIDYLERFDLT